MTTASSAEIDESTLRLFLAGDYRRLIGAFRVLAGSRAAAEDAVEEAVARALERTRRGEAIEDLTAWVATVARNLLRTAHRRRVIERQARRVLADRDGSSRTDQLLEAHADLVRAVAALPRRQREAIALHYFADLPVAQVARVTASTEGAVKVRLHRARTALASALGDPDENPERIDTHADH
jgi:RNA polymerase sigma-70 factor (ECF subfamily)